MLCVCGACHSPGGDGQAGTWGLATHGSPPQPWAARQARAISGASRRGEGRGELQHHLWRVRWRRSKSAQAVCCRRRVATAVFVYHWGLQ